MRLKKYISIAAAVLSIAAFCSCTKQGTGFFQGSYGFVTSGHVSCSYEVENEEGNMEKKTIECPVAPERGVLRIEPALDKAVLTMSTLSGEALVFPAEIDGTQITLGSVRRTVLLTVDGTQKLVTVDVCGKGYKTNGLLLLELAYSGEPFTLSHLGEDVEYSIEKSNVNCVANYQE